MNATEFNRLVRDAARNQPLPGLRRRTEASSREHHWKTSGEKLKTEAKKEFDFGINPLTGQPFFSDPIFNKKVTENPTDRLWKITVGPGTVNDTMAVMTYRRNNDPRGWVMPENYPNIALAERIYGKDFEIVDRPLTDRADPPFLLVAAPSATDPKDTGDFQKIADKDRFSPPFFRTAAMWKKDLYSAMVFLTAQPLRFSWVEGVSHFPLPTKNARFRIAVRSKMPARATGVNAGGDFPIAQLFLTRDPKARRPIATDTLYVRQLCFWSLWTANATPNQLLSVAEILANAGFATNIGLLGLPSGALAAEAFAAGSAILINNLLDQLGTIYENASSVEFWTAA